MLFLYPFYVNILQETEHGVYANIYQAKKLGVGLSVL